MYLRLSIFKYRLIVDVVVGVVVVIVVIVSKWVGDLTSKI